MLNLQAICMRIAHECLTGEIYGVLKVRLYRNTHNALHCCLQHCNGNISVNNCCLSRWHALPVDCLIYGIHLPLACPVQENPQRRAVSIISWLPHLGGGPEKVIEGLGGAVGWVVMVYDGVGHVVVRVWSGCGRPRWGPVPTGITNLWRAFKSQQPPP